MSQKGSGAMRVMKKRKSMKLMPFLFTAVASTDGGTLYNALEDLESELNCLENKHGRNLGYASPYPHAELYMSCQEDMCSINIGSTSPGHHPELYRSYQDEMCSIDFGTTNTSHQTELYRSYQEEMYSLDLSYTTPGHQTELYRSCLEEICSLNLGSTTPGHQTDLYRSCLEDPYQSYPRDIYCRKMSPKSFNRSFDEDSYDILDNHNNPINQANSSIIAMKEEIGKYQNILCEVRNRLVQLDEGLGIDNSSLNKKALRNFQSHSVNQVHMSLKAMMQEIQKYTDLIFGIRDGIVQLDAQLLEANEKAKCQRENHNNNKPSPSTVKDQGNQNNYIRKIFKSVKYMLDGIQKYQDILFGIRNGIMNFDNKSSEISIDSCDGGSFSTWNLDEWLVVDTV